MTIKLFDRKKVNLLPLHKRISKISLNNLIDPTSDPQKICDHNYELLDIITNKIILARRDKKPVILVTGAHLIKNGASKIIIKLMEKNLISHVVTNCAGSIHDWELAYQGSTAEDVRKYIEIGQFGTWQETGKYLNLSILIGATDDLGYGYSVGKMIIEDSLHIPDEEGLVSKIKLNLYDKDLGAYVDLLYTIRDLNLKQGILKIEHKHPEVSIQAFAYRANIPCGVICSIGHDIIYTSPYNNGAAIGRTSLVDFLNFTQSISELEGGVYLSVGSSIMSPMIFEKALSMSRNISKKHEPKNFLLIANDIQPMILDWSSGEPSINDPSYYNRIFKSFSRMGGTFKYFESDNVTFIHNLYSLLVNKVGKK